MATLKETIQGEVFDDPLTLNIYSVDASIYEIRPKLVVIPKNTQDILRVVKYCEQKSLPIIPRGAATGITGGCIGDGLILDCSKYLNQILEINFEEEYAVVEPGVIQDQLNAALSEKGYRLGPDTSTGNRATLGGMVANNSAGARSLKYGKMVDHVLEVEMVLATGEILNTTNAPSDLVKKVQKIIDQNRDEIKKRYPNIPRRVSGYNLDQLLDKIDLAKLIVGSEGSLGIITKIKVKIAKKPKNCLLVVMSFHTIAEAFDKVGELLTFNPIALELIDNKILEAAKKQKMSLAVF